MYCSDFIRRISNIQIRKKYLTIEDSISAFIRRFQQPWRREIARTSTAAGYLISAEYQMIGSPVVPCCSVFTRVVSINTFQFCIIRGRGFADCGALLVSGISRSDGIWAYVCAGSNVPIAGFADIFTFAFHPLFQSP